MALKQSELAECLREVGGFLQRRRPPIAIRPKLDYRADIKGSDIIFSSVRPRMMGVEGIIESPFAKIKWVASHRVWRLYWMRASGQWNLYPNKPECSILKEAISEIEADPLHCFFG